MMQRCYTLPVRAILQTLRDQNGLTALSALLPLVPGSPKQAGAVTLILGQGRVHTCTIRTRDGRVLVQGGEALKRLEQMGYLEWQVQGVPSNSAAWQMRGSDEHAFSWSQKQAAEEQRLPRRRVDTLAPAQQQTLSHRQRQVFALADGTRSKADIAALLHLSLDEVRHMLHTLQHEQLID